MRTFAFQLPSSWPLLPSRNAPQLNPRPWIGAMEAKPALRTPGTAATASRMRANAASRTVALA